MGTRRCFPLAELDEDFASQAVVVVIPSMGRSRGVELGAAAARGAGGQAAGALGAQFEVDHGCEYGRRRAIALRVRTSQ